MNNKGSTLLIVGIIFLVIVILLLVIGGIVFLNKTLKKTKDNQEINKTTLYLISKDIQSQLPLESKYQIYYYDLDGNQQFLPQGNLIQSWNEIEVPKGYKLYILCWNDDYYLNRVERTESQSENEGKFTVTCNMQKKGNILINHTGALSTTFDIINLNLDTKDYFHKVTICPAWSAGIIDVSLNDNFLYCEEGWKNYTINPVDNKQIKLENGSYICGDWIVECDFVQGNRCNKKIINEIPDRYKGRVDKCFNIGRSLHNETYNVQIEIRSSDYKNELDEITFFVLGMKKIWQDNQIKWVYDDKDYQYTIPYTYD